MAQLIFNVKNQWIRREDNFKPVAKSKNYLYAKFKFLSEEWTGTPTALFGDSQNTYEVLLDQNGECLVPWEVIHGDERNFTVSVFCGDLVTANKLKIRLYESGYTDDVESETPPTPSVYNQIIERMDGVEQTVVDSAAAAAGSASSASSSAGAASGSAAQAAQSASAASTSAQAAASAASSADQKATAAAGSASESASKASEAAASATLASRAVSAAAASAGEAASSATAASGSATTAWTKASEAASSASAAAGSASSASSKASEAAGSATAAAESATIATTKAGEASSSATAAASAKNAAITAKNAAETAKNDAVSAKDAAETAKEATKTIANSIPNIQGRVFSLTETGLYSERIIETVGIPIYVENVLDYAAYGIEDTGWYVFCRIKTKDGETVTNEISVEGDDGHIAVIGEDHIDVAIRFEVAAVSKKVIVNWGTSSETFVFKATDLAIRNLDYRVTFYVYDIDEFITWEYTPATDDTFVDGKAYFTEQSGVYSAADVTAGDSVPTAYYVDEYELTTDEVFIEGTTYYTKDGTAYTAATVTAGEPVPEGTYYVHSYVLTSDVEFAEGTTYYTKDGTAYTAATVTAGEPVPEVIFVHAKARIEGMTRNITYRCNTTIDCPVEFVLPAIEDDCHGCWYEIRFRHAGTYSITLIPTDPDIKVATEHTQAETAGINMVNLHYTSVDGVKIWRFMNTHSTIPA